MKKKILRQKHKSLVRIPAHVPIAERRRYTQSYTTVTRGTGRVMLMAGDQKMEHLNDDFYGEGIHADDAHPEHLFRIAHYGDVGCFAAQHGLIAQYGMDYPQVPYVVKMNSKTSFISKNQADPCSLAMVTMQDVVRLRQYGKLNIVGVGYTIYFGSEYESAMIAEAGKLIAEAHALGMLAFIWAYPRGKAVTEEKSAHVIAGAAGAAACLGADFIKVNYPSEGAQGLQEAVSAAGRSGVIVSGGDSQGVREFLQYTYDTIHIGRCLGSATGRNVHQKAFAEGVAMTRALSALVYNNATVDAAYTLFNRSIK